MLDLSKNLTKLPPNKRQLLELLLREQGVDLARLPISAQRNGTDSFPLSFAQQRLWFLDRLQPGMPFYNMPLMVRLIGELRVDVLERTFSELIRRHEVFRTSFPTVDDQPVQRISPPQPVTIEIEDLTTDCEERDTELRRRASREAVAPFDLDHGPVFRLRLLRLDMHEHVLLLTMHHIISDGWSMGVMIRELASLYTSFFHGKPSPLPELAIQYADFAVWQQQWLSGAVLEEQLEYWQRQLSGELPVLALTTDKTPIGQQRHQGAVQVVTLSWELSERLRELSVREGVTMFMVLLAGWQLLLSRYSGQDDICIGTPIANRNRAETEGLIGFFVNTLVLRTDLSGEPNVRELLGRVREVCLGAYGHQDMPFEKLVEVLAPDRDLNRTPLFQTMFILQNAGTTPVLELPGLRLESVGSGGEVSEFDLTLSLSESESGVHGELSYRTELFEAETMARLARHYEEVLRGLAANPEQRLSELSFLTESERRQLVVEWNETPAYSTRQTIAELFEAQVERTPETTALVCDEQVLSYAELNERANQLAHYLVAQGVGGDSIVALLLPRGPEFLVSLLAVLKAGGAYLPLEVNYPEERLRYVLADAQVGWLLTDEEQATRVLVPDATVICVDDDVNWCDASTANLRRVIHAEQLAYVIYTSGSTGYPKGVLISHGSLVTYTLAAIATYGFEANDRVLQFASVGFDAHVEELYPTLCSGATVYVRSEEMLGPATDFLDQCARLELSGLILPTAYWHELSADMQRGSLELPDCVRFATIGGERALTERALQWLEAAGTSVRLFNTYGPTETTVVATYDEVNVRRVEPTRPLPIGRPFANTQTFVLDDNGCLCPIGVPGELYLGGAGLARGYLRRPELTAERFIPDPYSAEPGARLYRTGDRARYLGDGNLEYLGRLDEQVKLRGYRIELGEIEAVLRRFPGVSECVVLAVERGAGEAQLTAYVVSEDGPAASAGEWRRYLQQQLPEFMVPAQYVSLTALPLTTNGKLDRRALAQLEPELREAAGTSGAARSPVEEMLQSVWQELLGREHVGIHENFFALGGHSLLATRLISRVRVLFQIELPLRALFDAPTIAGLAVQVEHALGAQGVLSTQGITVVSRAQPLPLSYAQERLWFLDQLLPDRTVYNMPQAVRVSGELSLLALEQSLSEIVRRHETLRTRFPIDKAGEVWQEIQTATGLRLEVEDLQEWIEEEREQEVWRRVQAEAIAPFDLTHGPLLRVRVLRLSEGEHIVMLTLHHIISDGWSMDVLIHEMAVLYPSFLRGEPSPLPELAIQYADFAVWQRQWLSGAVLEGQLEYWQRQLGGELPVLALEPDKRTGAEVRPQGAGQDVWLSGELSEQLRELSVREGVTMFMVLLAGWQLLLSRYSGQEDICVGTPIANRNRAETEELIGFFVNTLVLRTDLSSDPKVRELLGRVREVCLGAYGHQDMPFEKLVEVLAPDRDLNRTPLFQTMFNLQNAGTTPALELPGLQLESFESGGEIVKFDLTLSLTEGPYGVQGGVSYRTELFEAQTMARLARHYEEVLRSLAANPEQRVSELSFLTESERRQLVVEWNETAAAYQTGQTIAELFEAQVERTPLATALICDEHELSYQQLNERANRLAHYLAAQGVGAESIVALLLPRGPELLVSLLAVLKAGGAYLPLEVNYPVERLRYVLADAQAGWLLTDQEQAARVRVPEATVICVDDDTNWREASTANLGRGGEAEQLAYVIYTSGSSGTPKGVMVTQGAVVNLSWALQQHIYAGQGAPLRVGLNAPLVFDASVKQVLQLLRGHTLCVLSEEVRSDAGALLEYLEKQQVEVLDCTPSQLRVLLEEGLEARLGQSLKVVLVGGEELSGETWDALRQSRGIEYYNVYGPTECTVDATAQLVSDEVPSIGRPLGNMESYVLDQRQQLAPLGVAGELYIGGAGLARGYLRRPELTAERFIPHPFSAEPGARLYRTGDRVRYLADGRLEYLGRLDQQVKLRGYRIELGEIEAVLRQQEQVQQAVVVIREERLVAYVVSDHVNTAELRERLRQRLPDYMVPYAFVMLDKLPLTPNGKVDRRALPVPVAMSLALEQGFVAPRTPVEEIVADIWKQMLNVESLGIEDNFFELGGHSLLATRVISRVRDAFGKEVSLRSLFEHPTVAGLAQTIENAQRAGAGLSAPAIVPVSRDAMLPLSFAQQRLWFLDQLEPDSSFYNIPAAVRLWGVLNVEALERTMSEVMRRHEVLRTRFIEVNGEPVQVIEPVQEVHLTVTDLSAMAEAERTAQTQRLIDEESARPFDLMSGPLLRMSLIRLGAEEHVALVTMHHIVSDGWSIGVLIREVAALYAAYVRGEESPLEELPIQYADFAHWQRKWLQGEVLTTQLDYWRTQLADAPAVIDLPIDKPRPPVQTFRGAYHPLHLSTELSTQLRDLSRENNSTLFMTLLAAFDLLLCRYAGQEQVLVGTPIANRNRSETEGLIGFFVNTLVLRGDVRGNPTFRELLLRVRETALGAYAHQDLPFEKLVEELQPERDMSRTPLFQVMFVLQNAPGEALELEGLRLTRVESADQTAPFELMLGLQERGGAIAGGVQFNPDLYEADTIARMVQTYERLLRAIAADSEQRVLEIDLLSEEERRHIIDEWNDTEREYHIAGGMHRLFEAQVERTPAATALVFGDQRFSYRELNERANMLAHYLREIGVSAEDRVGILMERSPAVVVSLLGVLKAGGCYVPLDPRYPQERLEFMQADAGVRVMLTTRSLAEVAHSERVRLVYVDEVEQAASSENLSAAVNEHQLAYLIYTSGSTGVPKGVAITHGSAETFIHWASEIFDRQALSGVLFSTSICFDLSIFEVFVTLSNGGKVILAENALQLPELSAGNEVTLINTVPSAMAELVRMRAVPESVQVVNLAGEALSEELVAATYATTAVKTVYNLYGPSEDTTYSTFTATRKGEPVTIGRPIANTRAYVLDANRQCVPVGVVGELYLGGEGLARGYFARPELTAEKFVPDSLGQTLGGRLYRTGDLARYLDSGELQFLGRVDHQVKIRGYRIELGEIEAVLRRYPGVSECAVLAGEAQLTAYVVSEAAPSTGEWRRYLQQQLPEYMVPAQFVSLAELPLTANGKLDRRALARLEPMRTLSETEHVGARDVVEQKLVHIWEDVLKVKPIGVQDDFFHMGGHSLLAVNLMARIRSSLGQKLPLSALFQGRTIESLAQLLRTADLPATLHPALVEIQPNGSELPLFCVHAIGGNVFSYTSLSHHLGSQRPFYGLQARGLDGKDNPSASVEEMASDYIEAVRSVQPDGPYILAGWSMGGLIALEMARQLKEHGQEVARLLLIDTAPDHYNRSQLVIPDHELLTSFLIHAGIRTDLSVESIRSLSLDEQLAHVLDRAQADAVLPPDANLADIRHLFEVYKTNLTADRSYVAPPIPCSATLFKASEQPERRRNEIIDRWRALAPAGIEVEMIPGDHFSILREPNVQLLAGAVKKNLAVNRFVSVAN